jgi:hypothetical protein
MLNKSGIVVASLLSLALGVRADSGAKPAEVLPADRRWAADGPGGVPGFTHHVQPLLGKLGCSNRACHGSFQGQGGFRLSLFGSDPAMDHDGLVQGQRVDVKDAEGSLALLKPTRQIAHKGGQRFAIDGWEYRLLKEWIAAGAAFVPGQEAVLRRLEILPAQVLLSKEGASAQLRVLAHYSDRTVEDVTALTQFASNGDAMAAVSDAGRVSAGQPGDTAVVATFGGEVGTVPVLVPLPGAEGPAIDFPPNNQIDELVAAKLKRLRIVPSELCTDEEFLRRVSLDIAGTLPTPTEVLEFVADQSADKRTRKIDELLDRPAYAVWWTTKLCDLTGLNAPSFLGSTDFGPLLGDQWHRWLERKVRDNLGYDRIVAGIVLGTSRQKRQSYDDFALEQSAYVRTANPVDFAAQDQMPHFWFRGNITEPEEKALAFAYTFLGVRLDCAQCHKHPFDRWTQRDFQRFTALFERIRTGIAPDAVAAHQRLKDALGVPKMKNAAERRQTYWRLARQGKAVPWPEVYIGAPQKGEAQATGKLLAGPEVDLTRVEDPRVPLMDWLRQRDNPYFAPALVNRVWAHYFGKGLVDPPDDHNLGNPASNPELLRYLARGFSDNGYDMKWLHREITRSRTYQLSWKPNTTNREDDRNFSHALIRRLPAEVAVDALFQATAGAEQLARATTGVAGRRIGVQATADERRTEFALVVFGKPLRKVNCDCERGSDPSLLQSIFLRNDPDLLAMLDRRDGWLREVDPKADHDSLIREAYLRSLSRLPNASERARCRQHLAGAANPAEGLRDLLWALLNTQEFITNH